MLASRSPVDSAAIGLDEVAKFHQPDLQALPGRNLLGHFGNLGVGAGRHADGHGQILGLASNAAGTRAATARAFTRERLCTMGTFQDKSGKLRSAKHVHAQGQQLET
jgi:hypothetical protein